MNAPTEFMGEILDALKHSDEERIKGMIHGINLPPNAFEMIAPMFRELYGLELKASIIDIKELPEQQMQYVKMAPQAVLDSLKYGINLEYEVVEGQDKVSGNISFPVYLVDGKYKILLVGGPA